MNQGKKYRLFNPPSGSPRELDIDGKPILWGMLGPLPDNVINYIIKNSKPVVNYKTGKVALHPTTKKPYIKPIIGKNKNEWYFFDETNRNWWTTHERFEGKAVILTPNEWNNIFNTEV